MNISEGVRAGAKAASIACVVSAVPTVCTLCRFFPPPLVTHVLRFYSAELWSRFHFLYPMNSRYIILDTDKRTTMSSLIFVFDLCNYSFCSEYYMHINLQLTIILVIITIENISKVELWILICSLNFFFPVDCLSYDTMGQGKSQLYCSGTHYICW